MWRRWGGRVAASVECGHRSYWVCISSASVVRVTEDHEQVEAVLCWLSSLCVREECLYRGRSVWVCSVCNQWRPPDIA